MVNVHEILKLAAEDSEEAYTYNLNREPSMRMSRAGLPLLQLALEDFIFPSLPKLFAEEESPLSRAHIQRIHKRKMALSTGFLYEKVVGAYLAEEYPSYEVLSQQSLEYEGITGTCDFLLLDNINEKATVIECKALDVDTLKEAKEHKLLVDNWGYLSQLCLYGAAIEKAYPEYTVNLQWRVWAKKSSKSFVYNYTDDYSDVVNKALERLVNYSRFKSAFASKDVDNCLSVMIESTEADPLPLRQFYYGQLSASCGLHFSPWANAILDADGQPLHDVHSSLKLMLEFCFEPTAYGQRKLKELLDNPKYTAV